MDENHNGAELLKRRLEELQKEDSTKTEIAKSCGMSVEQLRHIEAGRRSPTLAQALAIEDQFPEISARSWL